MAGVEDEPLVEEGKPERKEEGGELGAGGGGGGKEEEDDNVDGLASFLESEILSGSSAEDSPGLEQEEGEEEKRMEDGVKMNKRKQDSQSDGDGGGGSGSEEGHHKRVRRGKGKGKALAAVQPEIDTCMFSNIPPELFLQILKLLSSEDLIPSSAAS